MEYQLVELEEKMAAGLIARTNNYSPDMGNVISGLWERFFGMGFYSTVVHKANGKTLGIYTDYEGTETGDYSVLAACEVKSQKGQPDGITMKTIPAGTYAKFTAEGDVKDSVLNVWQQLWNMDLPRSFVCDFEEYETIEEGHIRVHIYIGLKK
ncbi:GyrI-like domain-containing protein [Lacrimispora sp. 38-1]|uniref:GyrI-like domain-containing protein n=1 Tax=Lacrimispora sp. 38-1 TaxID=3125778 RepID=UPI003CECE751